jgi:hypothetical protein
MVGWVCRNRGQGVHRLRVRQRPSANLFSNCYREDNLATCPRPVRQARLRKSCPFQVKNPAASSPALLPGGTLVRRRWSRNSMISSKWPTPTSVKPYFRPPRPSQTLHQWALARHTGLSQPSPPPPTTQHHPNHRHGPLDAHPARVCRR